MDKNNVGLWIAVSAVAAVFVGLGVVFGVILLFPQPDPIHVVDEVAPRPIQHDGPPGPHQEQERDHLLAAAQAHWRLGLDAKHPKHPLIAQGKIEFEATAAGPGAREGAKVARLSDAYFDAGRDLNPTGDQLTVYLRVRDPSGRWNYGLFSKRGSAQQLAFNLFSGDVAGTPGPDIGFEVRTMTGHAVVSFPITSIDSRAWHDLVGRYDGSKLQIICDGSVLAEKPFKGELAQNTRDILIGGEAVQERMARVFTGEMEESALWTRALSDDELAKLTRKDRLVVALVPAPPPPVPVNEPGLVEVKAGEVYRNDVFAAFICVTPDGRYALFQQPRGISVWGIEENRELRVLPTVRVTMPRGAVSADGKWLAVAMPLGKVALWDLETGQLVRETLHGPPVFSVAFSADSSTLLTGGGRGKKDNSIKLWDVVTGNPGRTLEGHDLPPQSLAMNDQGVYSMDGTRMLRRWDAKTGQVLDERRIEGLAPLLIFSPNARHMASLSADRVRFIEVASNKEVGGAPLPPDVKISGVYYVTTDGRLAAVVQQGTNHIWIFDLVKGTHVKTLQGPQAMVRAVALSPDGRRAFSVDQGKMFRIYDLQ